MSPRRGQGKCARRAHFPSPERGTLFAPGGCKPRRRRGTFSQIHRRCRFYSDAVTVAPRAYFFLSCQKKVCKKEALDAEIALTREKACRSVARISVTLPVKERPSGGVLASFISLTSARGAKSRPFRCSSFSRTNRFAGFAWEPLPLWNPLKTTKKRADAPFLDFSRSLVRAKHIPDQQRRDADAYTADRRGSRNTLRCCRADRVVHPYAKSEMSRISYVKYSTGANIATPHGVSCVQETRFYGRPKGVRSTDSVTITRTT